MTANKLVNIVPPEGEAFEVFINRQHPENTRKVTTKDNRDSFFAGWIIENNKVFLSYPKFSRHLYLNEMSISLDVLLINSLPDYGIEEIRVFFTDNDEIFGSSNTNKYKNGIMLSIPLKEFVKNKEYHHFPPLNEQYGLKITSWNIL